MEMRIKTHVFFFFFCYLVCSKRRTKTFKSIKDFKISLFVLTFLPEFLYQYYVVSFRSLNKLNANQQFTSSL